MHGIQKSMPEVLGCILYYGGGFSVARCAIRKSND